MSDLERRQTEETIKSQERRIRELEYAIDSIRVLCDQDGVSPTVAAIRRIVWN